MNNPLPTLTHTMLTIANDPSMLLRLWRAFAKMQKAANQGEFRAGLIQLAKALESTPFDKPGTNSL